MSRKRKEKRKEFVRRTDGRETGEFRGKLMMNDLAVRHCGAEGIDGAGSMTFCADRKM